MSATTAPNTFQKLLETFDGSSRTPRGIQSEVLKWVQARHNSPILAIQAPTGVGKSAIARAIQIATGGAIIVPNNMLIDQYADTYPDLNVVKGAANYECAEGGTCDLKSGGRCPECPYSQAKRRAKAGEPTAFNPISFHYADCEYDTLIVDEAHQLVDTVRLLIKQEFPKARYPFELNTTETPDRMVAWLREIAQHFRHAAGLYRKMGDLKKALISGNRAARVDSLADGIRDFPDYYIWYMVGDGEGRKIVVEPVELPPSYLKPYVKAKRLILLSATLPKPYVQDIVKDRPFEYVDLASPIPVENRQIKFRPAGLTAKSEPVEIAAWIKKQLKDNPGNAIVHTTYSMGNRLREYFPDAYIHAPETKKATLDEFRKKGGLWIAAGCAEGIDLPGDVARVNLIPVLPYANYGAPLVQAIIRTKGRVRYVLDTAVQFIQQAGRSTRGETDKSVIIVGDDRLISIIQQVGKWLPDSFKKAIVWR